MPASVRGRGELSLAEIATLTNSTLADEHARRRIGNIASLDTAGVNDICFFEGEKFLGELAGTRAGACFMAPRYAAFAPSNVAVLLNDEPYRAFVAAARALLPEALSPQTLFETSGRSSGAHVHASARIEAGVSIDPLALIGPRAQIGAGSVIAAGVTLGPDVCIGRRCAIGAGVTLTHALVGDGVIIRPGARLGQDGFGYRGDDEEQRLPPACRLIIQDDAEIGANATIDRGSVRDTIVGEGTKIDNLVQIAQNVRIGRHCLIGTQSGIADGASVGDFVIIEEQVGLARNVKIGDGARLVARCTVAADVVGGGTSDNATEPDGGVQ